MLLTGTFLRSLDDKHRLAIPKRIRDALGAPTVEALFVTPGTDGSLALYTEATLAALGARLEGGSPAARDVRTFSRLLYAQAQRVDLDGQGRVRIPPDLVAWARLGRAVVLLGVRDHLELWNRSQWEEYLGQTQPFYDQIAERAFQGEAAAGAAPPQSLRDTGRSDSSARPPQPR